MNHTFQTSDDSYKFFVWSFCNGIQIQLPNSIQNQRIISYRQWMNFNLNRKSYRTIDSTQNKSVPVRNMLQLNGLEGKKTNFINCCYSVHWMFNRWSASHRNVRSGFKRFEESHLCWYFWQSFNSQEFSNLCKLN